MMLVGLILIRRMLCGSSSKLAIVEMLLFVRKEKMLVKFHPIIETIENRRLSAVVFTVEFVDGHCDTVVLFRVIIVLVSMIYVLSKIVVVISNVSDDTVSSVLITKIDIISRCIITFVNETLNII